MSTFRHKCYWSNEEMKVRPLANFQYLILNLTFLYWKKKHLVFLYFYWLQVLLRIMFACTRPICLVGICILLANWNSTRVDLALHSDKLSWFRANLYLLLRLIDAYLAAKRSNKYKCFSLWFNLTGARTHHIPPLRRMS
jgi:hypothetical protein